MKQEKTVSLIYEKLKKNIYKVVKITYTYKYIKKRKARKNKLKIK